MSSSPPRPAPGVAAVAAQAPPPSTAHADQVTGVTSLDDPVEKRLDAIEMAGEEEAAGFTGRSEVTAGMRYLHCSRTINQLVTDRNRAVGIYLAVASLLWTATSAILNARPDGNEGLIVPLATVKHACLPVTAGTLAVLAVFAGLLLIRTRIGLLYEVAKMNVLLGLPVGRVKRISPLSIFFIMHAFISLAGGASAALFVYFVRAGGGWLPPLAVGAAVTAGLLALYVGTVLYTTSDRRLQGGAGG